MTMMHEQALRLISERLDRSLTPAEAADLDAHLAICPSCIATSQSLPQSLQRIGEMRPVSVNPEVRDTVLHEVWAEYPRHRTRAAGFRQSLRVAGAVLSIALVAIILTTVFRGTNETTPTLSGGTSASPSPGTPECVPEQVLIDLQFEPLSGMPGVIITLRFEKATGGDECRIDSPLTASFLDQDGNIADVLDNPLTVPLDVNLSGNDATLAFAWLNWCGEPGQLSLTVELPELGEGLVETSSELFESPACSDPEMPSILGESSVAAARTPEGIAPGPATAASIADPCQATQRAEVDASGSSVTVWMRVTTGTTCSNPGRLIATIRGADGAPLDVQGNPTIVKHLTDISGSTLFAGITWANWCGSMERITLDLAPEDGSPNTLATTGFPMTPPECADDGQPSTLAMAEGSPADLQILPPTPTPSATMDAGMRDCIPGAPESGGDIALSVTAGGGLTSGQIGIGITANRVGEPCHLQGDVTVTLVDRDTNEPLVMHGNPTTHHFDVDLHEERAAGITGFTLTWSNWCGDATSIAIVVEGFGQRIAYTGTLDNPLEPARCISPGDPSWLQVVEPIAGPTPTP